MSDIQVGKEPLTYHKHSSHSYFQDLALREQSSDADSRITRHGQEMSVEFRVNPSRTQGQGGSFSPPLWLIEQFATAPRAKRVLADLIPTFPLPQGYQSVNIPRLTTGESENTDPDLAGDAETDAIDAAAASRVVTIEGSGDVALQLLEQSPPGAHLDWAFFKDLSEAYDQQLEYQLLFGTGAGSATTDTQLVGIANLTGIDKQTFTSATPKFSSDGTTAANNLYPLMGQASAQVGDLRKAPPEAWLMTTSRWSWIATSVDSSNRPIVPPDLAPPRHRDPDGTAATKPVSSIYGWPVYADDAIPNTLGAGANQDIIIACRPSDMVLLEGTPRMQVMLDVLSGTLQARLILRNYVGAATGRYPTGIATISGTGMVVQSGF